MKSQDLLLCSVNIMAAGFQALMLAMMLSDAARIRADSWKFPGGSFGNATQANISKSDNSSLTGRNAIHININTNPDNGNFLPFPESKPLGPSKDPQISISGFDLQSRPPHANVGGSSFNPYRPPVFVPSGSFGSNFASQATDSNKFGANKFGSGGSSSGFGTGTGFGTGLPNSNSFGNNFREGVANSFGSGDKFASGFNTGSNTNFGSGIASNNFGGNPIGSNTAGTGNLATGKFGGGFNPLPPPNFIPPSGFGTQCSCVSFYLCKAQDVVITGPSFIDQRTANKNISAFEEAAAAEQDNETVVTVTPDPSPTLFRSKRQDDTNDTETSGTNETDISGRSFRPFPGGPNTFPGGPNRFPNGPNTFPSGPNTFPNGPNGFPGSFPPQQPFPQPSPVVPGQRPITHTPGCPPMQVCCRSSIIPPRPLPGPNPRPIQPLVPQCGVRNLNGVVGRVKNPNIVEGETQFGEFPWQAAVLRKDGKERMYVCGASLVSPTHVLTAAHCVHTLLPIQMKVRLGEWDVSSPAELYPYLELNVAETRIHPHFYPGNLQHDIAVLRLDFPVDFSQFPQIAPVCLPPRFDRFMGRRCIVTGWGKDAFGFEGQYQNILKQVDLPVLDNFDCETRLKHTRLGPQFALLPGFMCAGGEPGKDACKGDGGSPLVCETEQGYVVAGIVSWGIGCGHPNIPGVYVRVSEYLEWIQGAIAF